MRGNMGFGRIFSIVVYGITASIMLTVGVSQWTAKKPVAFYTGEKPPAPSELSDVKGWNRAHGLIWLVYGALIALSCVPAALARAKALAVVPPIAAILLPLPLMIARHHALVKKYSK